MTPIQQNSQAPVIVLVAGYWLGAWAWEEVLAHLTSTDARSVAITLPGLDPEDAARSSRTLDEQAAAIEAAIDAAGSDVVLVAHSGANAPVSLVLDRNTTRIRRVVWVDSGPVAPGSVLAPDFPESAEELPLPPFDVLGAQASLEGLTAAHLDRFRARAVPEPGPVVRATVHVSNDARLSVPTTLVCCSIPSAPLLDMAKAGHPMFAEVARLHHVDVVDLPTGHWPMWSRSEDLAEIIRDASVPAT